ncbi:MAG: hypothetical protein CMG13_03990 [Candidatus Marinimicrobia bacterium]|nr:hypothetical protein [Candidatus Neomarinimicrobiota bacterium]|tara:strand:- start:8188 stop:11547 length:3360 start_codon:yes stop_codon:yes gene_type:complete
MKIIIALLLASLTLCGEIALTIKSDLSIVGQKVIDNDIKDSEYEYALKTFLIAVDEEQAIDVEFDVQSKRVFSDFDGLSPIFLEGYLKHSSLSESKDRLNYYISEPMYMRGVRIVQLAVSLYDYSDRELTLYDNLDLRINIQSPDNYSGGVNSKPLSSDFNSIISSLVDNYDRQSRSNDIGSCILFICGGNSLSHPSVQELIEWRKELGYEVHAAETSQIGSTTAAIKSYIEEAYQNWPNPPEYIVLIGDTGGSYAIPYFSTTWGSSDYDYTLIEGNDLLPEMIVGRISAEGSSDLSNIINKTLVYEKASYIDFTGTDWYESAALNADPSSSGNSTIITNEYVEEILELNGFENVETNYGDGNYSSWMQNQLSDGILYFNYRGYIGTSGFGLGNINNASNGYMNPFATFITCSTGDFNYTSLSEDFIRAGSATNPKGAVAAVGTATSSTHTAPNNIIQMAIYDGIFSKKLKTAGSSLVNAKVTLFDTYIIGASGTVDNFTHWNNLMGDPVLNLWTDTPQPMQVDHSSQINWGSNFFEVVVSDSGGEYIEDAWVTLYRSDWEHSISAYSDELGRALFNFEYSDNDDITITVSKKNFIPYQSAVSVSDSSNGSMVLDDYYLVNADGFLHSGESVDFYIDIESSFLQGDFTASVQSFSDGVDILNESIGFEIYSENTIGPFSIIANNLIDNEEINLSIRIQDDERFWDYSIPFFSSSAYFDIYSVTWGGDLSPNSTEDLYLSITNSGSEDLDNVTLLVSSYNSLISIDNGSQDIENIGVGEVFGLSDPVLISFSSNIISGASFNIDVTVTGDNFIQVLPFNVTVGSVSQNDPLGPDAYGYYIYDNNDFGYDLTPTYDWIEIDPRYGGDGLDLQISDGGNGNNISNSTKHVDLPFSFSFYGEEYNEVSVSSNGWLSFGHTNMESFRNYHVPGAGGPSPMVAAFWDDLKTDNDSGVYVFLDSDYVVVQWSSMRTYDQNSEETFQVILYNSVTPTGDDEIKIQYKEFNNTSVSNYNHPVYSTVGIENHWGDVGLEYTYNNQYPSAAMPLLDQSALFITTRNTNVYDLGDVNQDSVSDVVDIIIVINHILNIQSLSNIGEYLADINQNSTINILDVILLINIILDA